MAINFNEREVRQPFREFYGPNNAQMPLLIADKRVPISVAGVMERRLNASNCGVWKDSYVDTGDAFAYSEDKVKIVIGAPVLRTLTSQSPLTDGALIITADAYKALEGKEFTRKQLADSTGHDLTLEDAKKNPVWLALADGDQGLVNAYADCMFSDMKKRFGYNDGMGVYLDSPEGTPRVRVTFVGGLGSKSHVWGCNDLHFGYGRLVGVAPEALSAPGQAITMPTLEQALSVVGQHWGAVELKRK